MQATFGPVAPGAVELQAVILQAVLTLGLAGLTVLLYRRYGKAYFGWFAVAWGLYVLRLVAIGVFLATADWIWLYWHQVVTGWMALALLWAALVFLRRLRLRPAYLAILLFPPVWSYIAIYRLDNFMLAAGPAVLFLSAMTLGTGWVFLRHWRQVRSTGALVLAVALMVWGGHHLDYPFLRARGAWVPWGYYLDIVFTLAVGAGIVLLVLDDLRTGLGALLTLSGDLQRGAREEDTLAILLRRPLELPAVRGAALYAQGSGGTTCVAGAGVCDGWAGSRADGPEAALLARALERGRPEFTAAWRSPVDPSAAPFASAAVLPVFRGAGAREALAIVADARVPFAALDDSFLVALGQQIGAALANDELTRGLHARTDELERLQRRMVQQHEQERRRLSLHLHDETAQLFTAVKLQLGLLLEEAAPGPRVGLARALSLMDDGLGSIRNITNDLRPSLIDDLGLLPALRSLAADWEHLSSVEVAVNLPDTLPPLDPDAELALYRALQESLSNVLAHAAATRVEVRLWVADGAVLLTVRDNGRGFPPEGVLGGLERAGHLGVAGMRERIVALGGTLRVGNAAAGGAEVVVSLPLAGGA